MKLKLSEIKKEYFGLF